MGEENGKRQSEKDCDDDDESQSVEDRRWSLSSSYLFLSSLSYLPTLSSSSSPFSLPASMFLPYLGVANVGVDDALEGPLARAGLDLLLNLGGTERDLAADGVLGLEEAGVEGFLVQHGHGALLGVGEEAAGVGRDQDLEARGTGGACAQGGDTRGELREDGAQRHTLDRALQCGGEGQV